MPTPESQVSSGPPPNRAFDVTLPEDTKPALLVSREEIDLIKAPNRFYDVIRGKRKEPRTPQDYFLFADLAGRFHSYYNKNQVSRRRQELMRSPFSLLLDHTRYRKSSYRLEIVEIEST
jgi:arginyl-tRNA synthetase